MRITCYAVLKKSFLILALLLNISMTYAETITDDIYRHTLYLGGLGGFGSTTWNGLVPSQTSQVEALSISTPLHVNEGGGVWGISAGYEFTPCFAIEANYMHFPDAELIFDEESFFAFDNDDQTILHTQTQTGSLSAKLMMLLPRRNMRIFSSAGIASVIRDDQVNRMYRISPVFAFGVNLLVNDRVMIELASNYTAGYGESEINPVEDFVPFLYAIFLKAAWRL